MKSNNTKNTANKTLIVYYSYTGNNRLLAEFLAKKLDFDLCEIIEKSKRRSLTIILDMIFKRTPKLRPLEKSLNDYQHVVFIAPLWAGKIATPLKALLRNERDSISEYSFITFSGGYEMPHQMEKAQLELTDLTGEKPLALFEFDISDLFPKEKKKDIRTISGYHLTPEDLNQYKNQIQQVIEFYAPNVKPLRNTKTKERNTERVQP